MKYRPEVDGLRAVAVLPVILFHGGLDVFSGGFIGVDVFFVISGYLISTIILNDIEQNKFSLMNFYERRARRILPSLFLVTIASILGALAFLMPLDIRDFSKSVGAVTIFSSNILFWLDSGYFSQASELKPLLHTWSLAVEEQFYIFFPIFLMVIWRFGLKMTLIAMALIFVISIAMSTWAAAFRPEFGFYMIPTRAWELLIGVFAACYLKYGTKDISFTLKNTLSCAGLAMIIISIFVYDSKTPFPSFYALLPTIGAAFIILYTVPKTIAYQILSVKAFVGIGLVSYSAYLWHQPLFAFARHVNLHEPSHVVMGSLIVVTFVLAYFSWRYVEKPFRSKTVKQKPLVIFVTLFSLGFIAFSIIGYKTNGFEKAIIDLRFTEVQKTHYQMIKRDTDYNMYDEMVAGECHLWARNTDDFDIAVIQKCAQKHGKALVVLGDSHAMNLYNIMAKSDVRPFVVGISQGGCRPADLKKDCHYDEFNAFLENHTKMIDKVIFHQSGSYFIHDKNGRTDSPLSFKGGHYSFYRENITKTAAYLSNMHQNSGLEIDWVGPFLEYRYKPMDVMRSVEALSVNKHSQDIFDQMDDVISDEIAENVGFDFIPFTLIMGTSVAAIQKDCFMFRDQDHFSRCGENILSRQETLKNYLRR